MVEVILSTLISMAHAKVKIAVIDSGINANNSVVLCEEPKDFTNTNTKDEYTHGTNISGIIQKNVGNVDYCQYSLKVFSYNPNAKDSITSTVNALRYALQKKVQIVNYSGGGSLFYREEEQAVKALLDAGVVVIAAAGNNASDLDKSCNYYPACYDKRIIVIGSIDDKGKTSKFSNYGKRVNRWYNGENVEGEGVVMSGTSQATALASAEFVKIVVKRKPAATQEMNDKLIEATSKQFKLDEFINKELNKVKEKVPESWKPYLKYIFIGTETATKQKVEIRYDF